MQMDQWEGEAEGNEALMQVQTFIGKVGVEALGQMDAHINRWLLEHQVEPKHITQTFGYERACEQSHAEPVIITSVWY